MTTPETAERVAERIVNEMQPHSLRGYPATYKHLTAAITAALKAEREECAKVAEGYPAFLREIMWSTTDACEAAREIAAAIRGRL
jgi:hypothetical protein